MLQSGITLKLTTLLRSSVVMLPRESNAPFPGGLVTYSRTPGPNATRAPNGRELPTSRGLGYDKDERESRDIRGPWRQVQRGDHDSRNPIGSGVCGKCHKVMVQVADCRQSDHHARIKGGEICTSCSATRDAAKVRFAVQKGASHESKKYKIQNTKYKIQNTKYKIQNTKYKIQNTKR
jgi:hypothetical protein